MHTAGRKRKVADLTELSRAEGPGGVPTAAPGVRSSADHSTSLPAADTPVSLATQPDDSPVDTSHDSLRSAPPNALAETIMAPANKSNRPPTGLPDNSLRSTPPGALQPATASAPTPAVRQVLGGTALPHEPPQPASNNPLMSLRLPLEGMHGDWLPLDSTLQTEEVHCHVVAMVALCVAGSHAPHVKCWSLSRKPPSSIRSYIRLHRETLL